VVRRGFGEGTSNIEQNVRNWLVHAVRANLHHVVRRGFGEGTSNIEQNVRNWLVHAVRANLQCLGKAVQTAKLLLMMMIIKG
jgi:hypothetical protein